MLYFFLVLLLGTSVCAQVPLEGSPVCSDEIDVGYVYYPQCFGLDCYNYKATMHPHTIWYGSKFGECNPAGRCGTECDALKKCGTKGLSLADYNDCYITETANCNAIISSFIVYGLNDTHMYTDFYSGVSCTGEADRRVIQINKCISISGFCGLATVSNVLIPNCTVTDPPTTTTSSTTGTSSASGSTSSTTGTSDSSTSSTTGCVCPPDTSPANYMNGLLFSFI